MPTALHEYRTVDKSSWGPGPWQDEPDKVHWIDEATGLDCLIVRGPVGALCGYVGVPESHPLYGCDYGQKSPALEAMLEARKQQEVKQEHLGMGLLLQMLSGDVEARPDSVLAVHGGVTFADGCTEASHEAWERWRERMIARKEEALHYPKGDSARALRDRGHLIDDYEGWKQWMEQASICHVPVPGRSDRVWWFGFDCAHAMDLVPGVRATLAEIGSGSEFGNRDVYRDRAYVEQEVAGLAAQLAALVVP